MTTEEILGFFLSTDPMRAPVAKIIEHGRALAVAYKEVENRYAAEKMVSEQALKSLDQLKDVRQRDKEFSDKEIARLSNAGMAVPPALMNKLLEIENLFLKEKSK